MNKKLNAIVIATCLSASSAIAQVPGYSSGKTFTSQRLDNAISLFEQGLWNDCEDRLIELKSQKLTFDEQERIDFMSAILASRKDRSSSLLQLKEFEEKYPNSIYNAEVEMEIGSYYLFHNDFQNAYSVFNRIKASDLPEDKQHLLFFRIGQSLLELGRYHEARPYYKALASVGDPDYHWEALYYLAYLDYQEGNYSDALGEFQALPSYKKYSSTVPYYIVQILYHQKRWNETMNQAKQLLQSKHTTADQASELNRIIGECYLAQGNSSSAESYLNKYISSTSSPIATSAYNCGVLANNNGNTTLAIKALSMATSSSNASDDILQKAYMLLGQVYTNQAEFHNAQMSFERAAQIDADPKVQEAAAYNYAVMLHETGYSPFNEEVTVFEDFLNKYPSSKYADKASSYLVDVYSTTRNYESALESINKIKKPTAKIKEAKQRLLYQMGLQQLVNGEIDKAQTSLTQSIGMGNLNATTLGQAYYWLGECNYKQGNYKQAESDYSKFISIHPKCDASYFASAYYNLGYARFKQQKFTEATRAFEDYVGYPSERNTDPYSDALARIGDCYYYNRNFSQAETFYSESAKSNEKTSADYAQFQKAFMAGLQKRYTAKLDGLDLLIRNYPESEYLDDAYLERGKTYLLLDNKEYAIKAFQEVVNHFSNKKCAPQAGLQLALTYYNMGRINESVSAYKDVIALYPGSAEAQTALEDLKNIYIEKNEVGTYAAYLSTLDGKVPMAKSEQDSLTYVAATRQLANGNKANGIQALKSYLTNYPNGKFAPDANIYIARLARENKDYATALTYYDAITNITGSKYTGEALQGIAEIYQEQQNWKQAFDAYQQLVVRTDDAEYRRTGLMGSTRMAALLNKPEDVILNFTQLNSDNNLDPLLRQEGKMLRGKALITMGEYKYAIEDLKDAAQDPRTAAGAEAKFTLADLYHNQQQASEAEATVFELINSGTPHQYWLARGFILLADISIEKGDKFQAKQYLQSLQNNYSGNAEINSMISKRMSMVEE